MEAQLKFIEEALNKCLKCQYYQRKQCGAYFDVHVPIWSEEDWFMADNDEREERIAMCRTHKCDYVHIDSSALSDTPCSTPKDIKLRRRLLAKCQTLLSAIPQDERFWNEYGHEVNTSIYDLIAQIDFEALEDGCDLMPEFRMIGITYDRESVLYPRYTEGLVNFYLNQINGCVSTESAHDSIDDTCDNECGIEAFLDGSLDIYNKEFVGLDFFSKMEILKAKMDYAIRRLKELDEELGALEDAEEQNAEIDATHEPSLVELNVIPKELSFIEVRSTKNKSMHVMDEYISLYGGKKCSGYLTGILARLGIQSPTCVYSGESGLDWVVKNYNRTQEFQIMLRIEELKKHISYEISIRKDNPHELDRYIFSLFNIVEDTAKVLNPSRSFVNSAEIRTVFRCMRKFRTSDYNEFRAVWLASKDRVGKMICDGVLPKEFDFYDSTEAFMALNHEKFFDGKYSPEAENFVIISMMYDSFVDSIEAALLANSIENDIFYYQDKFGIYLADEISDIAISCANNWTLKTVRNFASELGHNITYSTSEKIQKFDALPFSYAVLGDTSGLDEAPVEEIQYMPYKGKAKSKIATAKLNTPQANNIYMALKRGGFTEARPTKKDRWVKDKKLFAYFCYKITTALINTDSQIQTGYIIKYKIDIEGNPETIARYASSYKHMKSEEYPDGYELIDQIINAGVNNQL